MFGFSKRVGDYLQSLCFALMNKGQMGQLWLSESKARNSVKPCNICVCGGGAQDCGSVHFNTISSSSDIPLSVQHHLNVKSNDSDVECAHNLNGVSNVNIVSTNIVLTDEIILNNGLLAHDSSISASGSDVPLSHQPVPKVQSNDSYVECAHNVNNVNIVSSSLMFNGEEAMVHPDLLSNDSTASAVPTESNDLFNANQVNPPSDDDDLTESDNDESPIPPSSNVSAGSINKTKTHGGARSGAGKKRKQTNIQTFNEQKKQKKEQDAKEAKERERIHQENSDYAQKLLDQSHIGVGKSGRPFTIEEQEMLILVFFRYRNLHPTLSWTESIKHVNFLLNRKDVQTSKNEIEYFKTHGTISVKKKVKGIQYAQQAIINEKIRVNATRMIEDNLKRGIACTSTFVLNGLKAIGEKMDEKENDPNNQHKYRNQFACSNNYSNY